MSGGDPDPSAPTGRILVRRATAVPPAPPYRRRWARPSSRRRYAPPPNRPRGRTSLVRRLARCQQPGEPTWERALQVVELIGGQWPIPVIITLAHQPLSHDELLNAIGCGLTSADLTATLHRLHSAGVIALISGPDRGPAYALTSRGDSLLDLIARLADSSNENLDESYWDD